MKNCHYQQSDITIKCDASRPGLGAVLEQNTSHGWKLIAIASRFLNTTQERYSANELKLLETVWSVYYFIYHIYCKDITATTDHRALLSVKNIDEKILQV